MGLVELKSGSMVTIPLARPHHILLIVYATHSSGVLGLNSVC
jgi:7-keto-8-aminopelargonate synthetase-like enzyme